MAVTQYQIFCRYFNGDINKCVTNQTSVEWVSKSENLSLKLFCETGNNDTKYDDLLSHVTGRQKPIRHPMDFDVIESEIWQNFQRKKEIEFLDAKHLVAYEICQIEPLDELGVNKSQNPEAIPSAVLQRARANRDIANYGIITDQVNISNPKYDMIFMYDGIAQVKGPAFIKEDGRVVEKEDYGQINDPNALYCRNAPTGDAHRQPYIYYDNMKRVNFDIWFEHSIHASLRSAMTKANELVNIVGKANVKIGKIVSLDKFIEIV